MFQHETDFCSGTDRVCNLRVRRSPDRFCRERTGDDASEPHGQTERQTPCPRLALESQRQIVQADERRPHLSDGWRAGRRCLAMRQGPERRIRNLCTRDLSGSQSRRSLHLRGKEHGIFRGTLRRPSDAGDHHALLSGQRENVFPDGWQHADPPPVAENRKTLPRPFGHPRRADLAPDLQSAGNSPDPQRIHHLPGAGKREDRFRQSDSQRRSGTRLLRGLRLRFLQSPGRILPRLARRHLETGDDRTDRQPGSGIGTILLPSGGRRKTVSELVPVQSGEVLARRAHGGHVQGEIEIGKVASASFPCGEHVARLPEVL